MLMTGIYVVRVMMFEFLIRVCVLGLSYLTPCSLLNGRCVVSFASLVFAALGPTGFLGCRR